VNKRVFVIGERDAVLGFSLVGIKGLVTDDAEAAAGQLAHLREDPAIGLILITAGLARDLGPRLASFRAAGSLPLIYEIPDRQGRTEKAPLRDLVRRALGIGA